MYSFIKAKIKAICFAPFNYRYSLYNMGVSSNHHRFDGDFVPGMGTSRLKNVGLLDTPAAYLGAPTYRTS